MSQQTEQALGAIDEAMQALMAARDSVSEAFDGEPPPSALAGIAEGWLCLVGAKLVLRRGADE